MTFEPDPLSERYEPTAGSFLGQAIGQPGRWHYRAVNRPSPGPRTSSWLRAHGIQLDAVDAGGLTAYERAYQRALYRVARELRISVMADQRPRWSLQREWGPVTTRGRILGIRLSDPATARRAIRRKPAAQRWTVNPELRSGAAGSGQERF